MRISFFGHADFSKEKGYENHILNLLRKEAQDTEVELLLGGYGFFDSFAYSCCKKYKMLNLNAKVILVTPYITEEYQNNHLKEKVACFDEIIYPPIEKTPLKFAISKRNEWMVQESDLVIVFIERNYGGAYKAYKYAVKNKKRVINIADIE